MTLQMKLKNMMMIGKDRTVFRYFEQSKLGDSRKYPYYTTDGF